MLEVVKVVKAFYAKKKSNNLSGLLIYSLYSLKILQWTILMYFNQSFLNFLPTGSEGVDNLRQSDLNMI